MASPRRSSRGPSVGRPPGRNLRRGSGPGDPLERRPCQELRGAPAGKMLRRGGVPHCPERDPPRKAPRSQPGRALNGRPRWRPPRRFPGEDTRWKASVPAPPRRSGPGAIRRGFPRRIPPRREPVGRHPGSDAQDRGSEEPRRGDAPAGRGQGQGGRDPDGEGSEEPAPTRRLEGASRGSLRRGRNGYGPRGLYPGGPPRRLSGAGPLLALTKAGRTRLQGIEPDQESVHPASGG